MIAIIPARGGSKGVPHKNIKMLCNKPLIAYTICAARGASCIDRVIVTTDDEEIATVASEYGAEIPFIRPAYLASDTAVAPDVYLHAVEYLMDNEGISIEKFMVLLPTAPFRTSGHIDEAYSLFNGSGATTMVSVKEAEIPPSWYLSLDDEGHIRSCDFGMSINDTNNRQFASKYYICNGAIYILDYRLLKQKKTYFCEDTIPYVMNALDSIDIDNADDFKYAEYMMMDEDHRNLREGVDKAL